MNNVFSCQVKIQRAESANCKLLTVHYCNISIYHHLCKVNCMSLIMPSSHTNQWHTWCMQLVYV